MNGHKEETPVWTKMVRAVAVGAATGTVVCLLLLLIMAAIVSAQDIPQAATVPMAVVAAAIGTFSGGFICARIAREKGLLLGLLCGALLYLMILLAGTIWFRDSHSAYVFVKLAILVGCGGIGGVVGVNLKKR